MKKYKVVEGQHEWESKKQGKNQKNMVIRLESYLIWLKNGDHCRNYVLAQKNSIKKKLTSNWEIHTHIY